MPFRSERQRRWMFANKPLMARKWAHETAKKTEPKSRRRRRSRLGQQR